MLISLANIWKAAFQEAHLHKNNTTGKTASTDKDTKPTPKLLFSVFLWFFETRRSCVMVNKETMHAADDSAMTQPESWLNTKFTRKKCW